MKTIRFSHDYVKMPRGYEKSELLEVFIEDRKNLSDVFVEYDTVTTDGHHYQLPSTTLIVLLLKTVGDDVLWTTMRRWSVAKEKYYRRLRGHVVNCMLEEADDVNNRLDSYEGIVHNVA